MFNNDLQYAVSRILGTFMLPKDPSLGLVLVDHYHSEDNDLSRASFSCFEYGKRENLRAMKIDELSFSTPNPGYVNSTNQGAVYLSRVPMRRDWRQGLRSSQFTIVRNNGNRGASRDWFSGNIRKISEAIRGIYPSFLEAVEIAEEIDDEIAFAKCFAIDKEFNLLYRGYQVGGLTRGDTLKLNPKFNFLEQELIKVIGNENFSR